MKKTLLNIVIILICTIIPYDVQALSTTMASCPETTDLTV